MLCGGAQIHVMNREKFRPFKTTVAVLKSVRELYPSEPLWRDPPYEYETERMPFDILAGNSRLRKEIEQGEQLDRMEQWWQEQCMHFNRTIRKRFLHYE
jgi:uncharacterized protein YbbC (DUF1343 family)